MTDSASGTRREVVYDLIYEEREPLYLASVFSPEEAADECGYALDEVTVSEEWYRPIRLSARQVGDDEYQSDINPDWEPGDPRCEVEFRSAKADDPRAEKYLRIVPRAGGDR